MPNLDSLEGLLQDELKDIYHAEKQLTKALPKLAKKASAPELKNAFDEHLGQTWRDVERIEAAFKQLGMPQRGKKCEGMQHLIAEGEAMIGEAEDGATRDAVMIASAQKVEHDEIASYGTLRTWANLLGKPKVAALMEETLEEEKETDQTLTVIAESFVNEAAADEETTKDGSASEAAACRYVPRDRRLPRGEGDGAAVVVSRWCWSLVLGDQRPTTDRLVPLQCVHERFRRGRRFHVDSEDNVVRSWSLSIQLSVVIGVRLQHATRDIDPREESLGT